MMKQVLYSVVMVLLVTGCSSNEKDNKASTKTTSANNKSSLMPPLRTVKEKDVAVAVYDFKRFEGLTSERLMIMLKTLLPFKKGMLKMPLMPCWQEKEPKITKTKAIGCRISR